MDETRYDGILHATRNKSWLILLATALVPRSDPCQLHGNNSMGIQLFFWDGTLPHFYWDQLFNFEKKASAYIKEESDFGFLFLYALTVDGRNVNAPFSTSMMTVCPSSTSPARMLRASFVSIVRCTYRLIGRAPN